MSAEHIEKTAPIRLLEHRRKTLLGWIADGDKEIAKAEDAIKYHKQQAIEIATELAEIEAALNALNAATHKETEDASGN